MEMVVYFYSFVSCIDVVGSKWIKIYYRGVLFGCYKLFFFFFWIYGSSVYGSYFIV